MSNSNERTYKRVEGFPWQTIEEQSLILNTSENQAHEMNSVGSFIWNSLDGQNNLAFIQESICNEFDVDSTQAAKDLETFILELESNKLIECL